MDNYPHPERGGRLSLLLSLTASATIGALFGVACHVCFAYMTLANPHDLVAGPSAPPESQRWRATPLSIPPEGILRDHIERDIVRRCLLLTSPQWRVSKANVMLHALRLWGKDQLPVRSQPWAGVSSKMPCEMVRAILDVRAYRQLNVVPEHVYYRTEYGVGVIYSTWDAGSVAHCNQLLKVLGEIGISGETALVLDDGQPATVSDLVADALKRYSPEDELEFSAIAFSRWLPPMRKWVDRHGDVRSFDELARALSAKTLGAGACTGAHLPYAIVNLLRANDLHPVLTHASVLALEDTLKQIAARLELNQAREGVWYDDWTSSRTPREGSSPGLAAITATGHHLEWIALAPERLRPNLQCVKRAALALANLISRTDVQSIMGGYQPFSHAARSLLLLRGESASDILRDLAER